MAASLRSIQSRTSRGGDEVFARRKRASHLTLSWKVISTWQFWFPIMADKHLGDNSTVHGMPSLSIDARKHSLEQSIRPHSSSM